MKMDVLPEGVSAPIKKGPGLYEFLMEAELVHYFNSFKNNLKVTHPSQLKFATDEDLIDLGMSKPELRRMRKYYDKHFANNYLSKFKKLLTNRKQQQLLHEFGGGSGGFPGGGGEYMISGRGMDVMVDGCVVSKQPRVPNKHIISPANITVNKELGMGEFGVVQQGVWCNEGERIQVAIKCLVRERMQTNTIEFLKEAVIMHSIDHPHIVRLFGVVLDMGSLMLVTELAPLRSLLECLKEPSVRSSFPVMTLADFAVQICDGMQYLEAKRFIHRDLAARNILVFSKNKVKISDFGLSRALGQGKDYYQTNFNVNLKLPIAWCAPECISYLRFTTASDVWAYGVTLWEMFSYGFQPWAALTGQQILEAIDDPHFQRLEQPDCCPHEYYALMLDCWRHEPSQRPRFSEIVAQRLPDCRPEQVQAKVTLVAGACADQPAQMIGYRVGDVVTVLDKLSHRPLWKGISPTGKSGLFDPTNFISYLGPDLPSLQSSSSSSHQSNSSLHSNNGGGGGGVVGGLLSGGGSLLRSSVRRSKLRSEMISGPQGEVKHTGHVGLDGAYFGDISFLSGGSSKSTDYNTNIPTQIVPPYRPTSDTHPHHHHHHHHLPPDSTPLLDHTQPTNDHHLLQHSTTTIHHHHHHGGFHAPTTTTAISAHTGGRHMGGMEGFDHEYHEISDEEELGGGGSPDLDLGPSLMAEMEMMFSSLGGAPPPPSPADHDGSNKTNELREKLNTGGAKSNIKANKLATTVKPISAQDSKTLDTAIAIANELSTARPKSSSHHHHHHHGMSTSGGHAPLTPTSPGGAVSSGGKRKFSFRFPSASNGTNSGSTVGLGGGIIVGGGLADGSTEFRNRNFAEEAQSTPDLQSKVTHEAQLAYQSLVDSPSPDSTQFATSNPLRLLRSGNLPLIKPRLRTTTLPNNHVKSQEYKLSNDRSNKNMESFRTSLPLNQSQIDEPICRPFSQPDENPIPLPPRDRNKALLLSKPRHTRKHPLIIPPSSFQTSLHKFAQKQDDIATTPPEPLYSNHPTDQPSTSLSSMSQSVDSLHFEARIDSELAALDHVPNLPRAPDLTPEEPEAQQRQFDPLEQFLSNEMSIDFAVDDDSRLTRHHVSCEDLLEFADTRPSSRERGEDSDEVRIMGKVLGTDYNAAQCVETLEFTDWDVIRAIKLCRLRKLVSGAEISACSVALETTGWDVTKAAQFILQHDAEVQV